MSHDGSFAFPQVIFLFYNGNQFFFEESIELVAPAAEFETICEQSRGLSVIAVSQSIHFSEIAVANTHQYRLFTFYFVDRIGKVFKI